MNFGRNSEILGVRFCANIKLRTQPAILVNCERIIDVSLIDNYANNGLLEAV